MGIEKSLKYFSNFDLFGSNISLANEGSNQFKSYQGAIISVIAVIIYIMLFCIYYNSFFDRINVKITSLKLYSSQNTILLDNSTVMLGLFNESTVLEIPKYLNIKVNIESEIYSHKSQERDSEQIKDIASLSKCNNKPSELFEDKDDVYNSLFNYFQCIKFNKNSVLSKSNVFDNSRIIISISINKCNHDVKNISNLENIDSNNYNNYVDKNLNHDCLNDNINLNNLRLFFVAFNDNIKPLEFTKTHLEFKSHPYLQEIPFKNNLISEVEIEVSNNTYEYDNDWIMENKKRFKYIKYKTKNSQVFSIDEELKESVLKSRIVLSCSLFSEHFKKTRSKFLDFLTKMCILGILIYYIFKILFLDFLKFIYLKFIFCKICEANEEHLQFIKDSSILIDSKVSKIVNMSPFKLSNHSMMQINNNRVFNSPTKVCYPDRLSSNFKNKGLYTVNNLTFANDNFRDILNLNLNSSKVIDFPVSHTPIRSTGNKDKIIKSPKKYHAKTELGLELNNKRVELVEDNSFININNNVNSNSKFYNSNGNNNNKCDYLYPQANKLLLNSLGFTFYPSLSTITNMKRVNNENLNRFSEEIILLETSALKVNYMSYILNKTIFCKNDSNKHIKRLFLIANKIIDVKSLVFSLLPKKEVHI